MLRSEPTATVVRFDLAAPRGQGLFPQGGDRDVTISPDGSTIVYRGGPGSATSQLYARALNESSVRPITGQSGREPFMSPDGRSVAYWSLGELRKAPITGGPPITIARVPAALRGANWAADNTIVFGTAELAKGLQSVSANGGEPKSLTNLDTAKGETGHYYPFVMPGGESVLFTIFHGNSADNAEIAVLDRRSGTHRTLVGGATAAVYIPTGHLVYNTSGTLRAVRFDARRLEAIGDPVPVVEQVSTSALGEANFAVSASGTLVYVPANTSVLPLAPRSLIWVNRHGTETATKAPIKLYGAARLSPDGGRVVVDIRDPPADIWVWDLAREALTPLNLDPAPDMAPVWTPDGNKIVWSSTRAGGNPNLYLAGGRRIRFAGEAHHERHGTIRHFADTGRIARAPVQSHQRRRRTDRHHGPFHAVGGPSGGVTRNASAFAISQRGRGSLAGRTLGRLPLR